MKRNVPVAIIFASMMATLTYSQGADSTPPPNLFLQPPAIANLAGNQIITNGEVLLKRADWSDYRPVSSGTKVYPGDLLRLAEGARATVQCSDGTSWEVPAGVESGVSNFCPSPEPIDPRAETGPARPGNLEIPYIVSPRKTQLLSGKPTLRWNRVFGASSYIVSLLSSEGTIWQQTVTGTEVVYPGEPSLKPGVEYLLEVVADSDDEASSDQETMPGLEFSLLSEEDTRRINLELEKLTQQNWNEEAQTLSKVHVYIQHNLMAESIEVLEAFVENSQAASAHCLLGELYERVGLNEWAEERYLQVVELADTPENLEEKAYAQAWLGEWNADMQNYDEAIDWLLQAKASYEKLQKSMSGL